MMQSSYRMTVRVLKKDGYWVGLPVDTPGSMMGDTLEELFEEVEALKCFCLSAPADAAVDVEYRYELPEMDEVTLSEYRYLSAQRDQIADRLETVSRTAVSRLKRAGVSLSDSAALLGLPASHVDKLIRGV